MQPSPVTTIDYKASERLWLSCIRPYRYIVITLIKFVDYTIGNSTTQPCMMTSSNGNIFRVTGPLCGEFTGPGEFPTQRPVTRSFDVFFDLGLNKRLIKNHEAGDLRRYRSHYDVIVMGCVLPWWCHGMKTLSALLVFCDGNHRWISLTKGQ